MRCCPWDGMTDLLHPGDVEAHRRHQAAHLGTKRSTPTRRTGGSCRRGAGSSGARCGGAWSAIQTASRWVTSTPCATSPPSVKPKPRWPTLTAELEGRVEQRTAELELSNKNLRAFSYSIAHDLRTPLRGLNGFSEALLEEYSELLGETGRGYAERIQAAKRADGRDHR